MTIWKNEIYLCFSLFVLSRSIFFLSILAFGWQTLLKHVFMIAIDFLFFSMRQKRLCFILFSLWKLVILLLSLLMLLMRFQFYSSFFPWSISSKKIRDFISVQKKPYHKLNYFLIIVHTKYCMVFSHACLCFSAHFFVRKPFSIISYQLDSIHAREMG